MNLENYRTFVFDCDGVLLDSNHIKSEAFYETALPYGREAAECLLIYHKENGGVSRFEKFKYFFDSILKKPTDVFRLHHAIECYGTIVRNRLVSCNETNGIRDFLSKLPKSARKIVVSGGMQTELREVFTQRNIDIFFDAIYGSPETKKNILLKERESGLFCGPAVFFGDSRLDYEVALEFNTEFIFISGYTEFSNWESYFSNKAVTIINDFVELNAFI